MRTYQCAKCGLCVDTEEEGNDLVFTVCCRCQAFVAKHRLSVFWDTSEVLLETLNPTLLDEYEESDDEEGMSEL
jgi:hypothetical protein